MNEPSSQLDKLICGLDSEFELEKITTKTVSVRIPILYLAQIDALARMKDMSRNVLLNEIIAASMGDLMGKLKDKNPTLCETLSAKAENLAKKMLMEPEREGPHHHPPRHKKKGRD